MSLTVSNSPLFVFDLAVHYAPAMKTRTYKQVETAKQRAAAFTANVLGEDDRAEEFEDMSVDEYADLKGITIQNPGKGKRSMPERATYITIRNSTKGGNTMASRIAQLEQELKEANERISELEEEREDVLSALGVEIVDDDSDLDETDED